MLDLDCVTSLTRPHLVTGVPEDEECGEDKGREKYGDYHQPLVAGQVVARLLYFCGQPAFRPCHTLLYKGDTRLRILLLIFILFLFLLG